MTKTRIYGYLHFAIPVADGVIVYDGKNSEDKGYFGEEPYFLPEEVEQAILFMDRCGVSALAAAVPASGAESEKQVQIVRIDADVVMPVTLSESRSELFRRMHHFLSKSEEASAASMDGEHMAQRAMGDLHRVINSAFLNMSDLVYRKNGVR